MVIGAVDIGEWIDVVSMILLPNKPIFEHLTGWGRRGHSHCGPSKVYIAPRGLKVVLGRINVMRDTIWCGIFTLVKISLLRYQIDSIGDKRNLKLRVWRTHRQKRGSAYFKVHVVWFSTCHVWIICVRPGRCFHVYSKTILPLTMLACCAHVRCKVVQIADRFKLLSSALNVYVSERRWRYVETVFAGAGRTAEIYRLTQPSISCHKETGRFCLTAKWNCARHRYLSASKKGPIHCKLRQRHSGTLWDPIWIYWNRYGVIWSLFCWTRRIEVKHASNVYRSTGWSRRIEICQRFCNRARLDKLNERG